MLRTKQGVNILLFASWLKFQYKKWGRNAIRGGGGGWLHENILSDAICHTCIGIHKKLTTCKIHTFKTEKSHHREVVIQMTFHSSL